MAVRYPHLRPFPTTCDRADTGRDGLYVWEGRGDRAKFVELLFKSKCRPAVKKGQQSSRQNGNKFRQIVIATVPDLPFGTHRPAGCRRRALAKACRDRLFQKEANSSDRRRRITPGAPAVIDARQSAEFCRAPALKLVCFIGSAAMRWHSGDKSGRQLFYWTHCRARDLSARYRSWLSWRRNNVGDDL